MKPNFSLSLSFDGIRLLYRGKSGWSEVGSVSLEDDDLAGSLAKLRAKALEQSPDGIRSKLIIPNEQIKYLDLPGKGLKDADIRAALEGATPYDVAELSYDFAEHGGGTAVAAVANETLDEAEAFATEHEFGPVSFVAIPAQGAFPGEPYFGKAKAAADIKVTRDESAVPLAAIVSDVSDPEETAVSEDVPKPEADEASSPEEQPESLEIPEENKNEINTKEAEPQVNEEPAADAVEAAEQQVPSANDETQEAVAEEDDSPETGQRDDDHEARPTEPPSAKPEPAASAAEATSVEELSDDDGRGIGVADDTAMLDDQSAAEPDAAATPGDGELKIEEATSETGSQEAAEEAAAADDSPDDEGDRPETADVPDPSPEEPQPALAEPVFSSRLRSVRLELDMPPPPPPPVRRPNGSISAPRTDGSEQAAAAGRDADPAPESFTPMPPAVAEALKKVERRESVPPRLGSAASAPDDWAPSFRPATPPPPAVSKALERVRNSPDLPPVNGATPTRPIPGAGPQAPLSSAPPSLPSAPSRSELPPPVRQTPKPAPATSASAIPAPPAEVGATLTASVGPAGEAPAEGKGSKRGLGLFRRRGAGRSEGRTSSKAAAPIAAPPETVSPKTEAVRSESEKERLTVFGARRKEEEVGGKPRFLGLILTAILLLLMAAVAAWATISTESFARFFGLNDPPAIALDEGTAPTPVTAATPPQAAEALEPAFEPTPLPATESPLDPGGIPSGDMLLSETGSLLPDPDLLRALSAPTPAQAVAEVPGAVLSPAAAERFYAATGVWLRAPRLPVEPQPEPLGSVARTVRDDPPRSDTAPQLPQSAPDAMLVAQVNPPPPDMRFERDDRGFLLATPEGTVTPYGLVIYAGSPSIVPPTRPGTPPVVPEPESTESAEASAPAEDTPAAPEAVTELAAAEVPAEPAEPIIAEATENLASEALAVLDEAPARPDARISTAGALNAAAISLNGIRPPVRPEDAVPEDLLPELELAAFAGPRPPQRPEGLAPEVEPTDVPEEEPPAADVEEALAGILQGAADPLATATPNAVASALRPDSRPNNFDRVVQQARARQSPASAPTASAPAASGSAPEAVSNAAAQPTGPVPQTVASAATQENAINLRQINLIGVYGRPSDRRALVRLSNGRYVRVGVGDSLDGGRVAAINDNTLNYVKSGRTLTLEIPSG